MINNSEMQGKAICAIYWMFQEVQYDADITYARKYAASMGQTISQIPVQYCHIYKHDPTGLGI